MPPPITQSTAPNAAIHGPRSPDAPLAQQKPEWFHHRGGITDWNDARQLVMNDVHGLPDLATEKPEVFEYLLNATRRWLHGREA